MSTQIYNVIEHRIPAAHIREYARASVDQEDVLELAIKQYIPKDNPHPRPGDITIIGGHASAFPKELYEPFWDALHAQLKAKDIRIRGVWIADVAWQGESGVLNEDKLGNDPSWLDHSRDLFLMVNTFRAQIRRPIIGVAHSMGADQLINLAVMHPRLFVSLALIEPIVQRWPNDAKKFAPAVMASKRRDLWPSRKAAEDSFRKSKLYQSWDPRVFNLWIKYGLREIPTMVHPQATTSATNTMGKKPEVQVTLTTTKHQEVASFLRANYPTALNPDPWNHPNPDTHADVDLSAPPNTPFYRPEPISTFHKLPLLRPGVCYIFGETSYLSSQALKTDMLNNTGTAAGGSGGTKTNRVREVTISKVGHFAPMEDTVGPAQACMEWILPELERWRTSEEVERKEWDAVPKREKGLMSEEYVRIMNSDWAAYKDPLSLKAKAKM